MKENSKVTDNLKCIAWSDYNPEPVPCCDDMDWTHGVNDDGIPFNYCTNCGSIEF